jgi:hypothetical protein
MFLEVSLGQEDAGAERALEMMILHRVFIVFGQIRFLHYA